MTREKFAQAVYQQFIETGKAVSTEEIAGYMGVSIATVRGVVGSYQGFGMRAVTPVAGRRVDAMEERREQKKGHASYRWVAAFTPSKSYMRAVAMGVSR